MASSATSLVGWLDEVVYDIVGAFAVATGGTMIFNIYQAMSQDAALQDQGLLNQVSTQCFSCGDPDTLGGKITGIFCGGFNGGKDIVKSLFGGFSSATDTPDVGTLLSVAMSALEGLLNPIPGLVAASVAVIMSLQFEKQPGLTVYIPGGIGVAAYVLMTNQLASGDADC